MLVKKKFKIDGIHCTSCVISIDMDLEDLDGIKSANTSYTRQESEIEFDEEKISVKEILLTIQKTGYKAELI